MKLRKKYIPAVIVLIAVISFSLPAFGAEKKTTRFGAWGSYSFVDGNEYKYDFVSFNPYWGIFLIDNPGYKCSLELSVEGFYNRHIGDFEGDYEIGVRPILRLHYGYHEKISPFFEASTAGILYTNLDVPETGSDLNFSSHLGAGLNYRISDGLVLSAAYRYRHISNAGLSDRNSGINHQQCMLGLSYDFN